MSKAEGNSFCTQVDFPVDLGPNKKKELSFGYEMILAYMSPFYIKNGEVNANFFVGFNSAPKS